MGGIIIVNGLKARKKNVDDMKDQVTGLQK